MAKPKKHPGQIDKKDAKRIFTDEFGDGTGNGKTKRDDKGKPKPKKGSGSA